MDADGALSHLLTTHVISAGSVLPMRKQIREVGQRIVAWGASGQRWCRSLWHTSHQRGQMRRLLKGAEDKSDPSAYTHTHKSK